MNIMKKERVVFYSKEDLAIHWMEKPILALLKSYNSEIDYNDINDIIELYNLRLYIENSVIKNIFRDPYVFIDETSKNIWSKINLFFNKLSDSNIEGFYNNIEDYKYVEHFWDLFEKCNAYKIISQNVFEKLFHKTTDISLILRHKNIVMHYDSVLSSLLKEYNKTAELIITHYEQEKQYNDSILFFPKSLSISDKNIIISEYIDDNDSNPNYLRLVSIAKDYSDFKLSDIIRLKAKRKYESELRKMHASNKCIKYSRSYEVRFSDTQLRPINFFQDKTSYICTYSTQWLKRNSKPEQLFCNFRYLFDYLDIQGRISLVSHSSEICFWDCVGMHSKNEFIGGDSFHVKNNIAIMNIIAYNRVLLGMNIRLEDVICDVFNKFCSDIKHLSVTIPVTNDTLGKIRYLTPEIESILKKYKTYIENNEIDIELISISSSPCKVENIPSLVNKKYVYINNNEVKNVIYEMFSSQGVLKYNWDIGKDYHNLYDLLNNETLSFDSLEDFRKERFTQLLLKNYLFVDNGIMKIVDETEMAILNELYYEDVISYWHLSSDLQCKIDQMAKEQKLTFGNTLFTKGESDYFNYYLNKTFCNGKDLRNKYMHGTHSSDEYLLNQDYYRLLILLILVLNKIIDDFICSECEKQNITCYNV